MNLRSPKIEELSFCIRLAYVVSAIGLISLMGGVVYGWPSMRQVLLSDGLLYSATECDGLPPDQPCNPQELAFGLIFTIAGWSNQGGRLFVGILLDGIVPRFTASGSAAVCCLGAVIFGLTSSTAWLSVGLAMIGVGGAGVQLALQSSSALFPRNRSLVMASLSGAFQAASVIFLIMESLHRSAGISRQLLFLVYAVILLVAAAVSLVIWPALPFGIVAKASRQQKPDMAATSTNDTVAEQPLKERDFRRQLCSNEYLTMIAYFSLVVLQAQFTIQSVGTQFEIMGFVDGDLSRIFNLCFSLSWVAAPLVGYAIDHVGVIKVLVALNTLLLLCPVCLLTRLYVMQVILGLVYAVSRVGIWATFFAFLGKTFGFTNYGKLAGGGCFASCVSLLQLPLLSVTLEYFQRDFMPVNILWIVLCIFMYPLIYCLAVYLERPYHLNSVTDATKESQRSQQPGVTDVSGPSSGSQALQADVRVDVPLAEEDVEVKFTGKVPRVLTAQAKQRQQQRLTLCLCEGWMRRCGAK